MSLNFRKALWGEFTFTETAALTEDFSIEETRVLRFLRVPIKLEKVQNAFILFLLIHLM